MGANHTTPSQAYQQGRAAALAWKPIYANPHTGVNAVGWRKGYLSVVAGVATERELKGEDR